MTVPYVKKIPYYGISTCLTTGIDRSFGVTVSRAMDNTHQRSRPMEDFNEFASLDMDGEANRNYSSHHQPSSIEHTPIRSNTARRAQSARMTHWDINDDDDNDDTSAAMMLMIRNGSLNPCPKRARSASAPHINPIYSNDLLDLLDIDDDPIQLATNDYRTDVDDARTTIISGRQHHRNKSTSNSTSFRSRSHNDVYAPTAMTSSIRISTGYPFYNYIDYSREVDMTPDIPLTAMGRVPTFPAKLHAILLRPELQHIVSWLPHGRSWKVYNSMEFEQQVIAIYFEFTKHPNSSFFRQAKLWGFLRMKQQGDDHDSYYHPKFLRGLPHLCKDVRRPPASHLPGQPPVDQEPDLTAISVICPIPDSSNAIRHDPTIRLDWFMKGKQQLLEQSKKHTATSAVANSHRYPPPPIKERMAKKTSSSTSASTTTDMTVSSSTNIIKRKRLTPECNISPPISVVVNHPTEYNNIEPVYVVNNNLPRNYDDVNGDVDDIYIDIGDDDDDEDEPPIDDDLGLFLDPFFSKGYHLYPFYDYVDYSTTSDMYPLQPYTDIGQDPTFPMLLHAMLLSQQQQPTEPIIQWQPHGRAWRVCSMTRFEVEVLPIFGLYISGGQNRIDSNGDAMGSFFRHVTRWGFKQVEQQHRQHPHRSTTTAGSSRCTNTTTTNKLLYSNDDRYYYHPKFLRGLPHLCKDWTMNVSTSSISTSQLTISEDDDFGGASNDQSHNDTTTNNNDTTVTDAVTDNDYPEPDFAKISQLHPVPEYDSDLTVQDLLSL